MLIKTEAYSRAGLLGNPSDGYFGKTISIIVRNFKAVATLYETPELGIEMTVRDKSVFRSLDHLRADVKRYGYYGGVRLIKASIKCFGDYCEENDIKLPARTFTVRYSSSIPRHVGLGGSSAIITATLRALCRFYAVEIPLPVQANLILSVETGELGISAGLQDRVIQVYEKVVYMDFSKELMEKQDYGAYEPMDPALLPPLFVAYRTDLSEGSEVFHNNIRQRFTEGDKKVVDAMKSFAEFAERGRQCLLRKDWEEFGRLMDANYDLRASIYRISDRNKELVAIGRELGVHTKFAGSGGTVVGMYRDEEAYESLQSAYTEKGYRILKPIVTEAP